MNFSLPSQSLLEWWESIKRLNLLQNKNFHLYQEWEIKLNDALESLNINGNKI